MSTQTHDTIKSMVNSFLPNAQVLLFGSRARGEFSSDSDYDLLVITQETFAPRTKMNWESRIRKALVNELICLLMSLFKVKRKFQKKRIYPAILFTMQ